MFSTKEKMVLLCLYCICFSLFLLFNFSHFHSSIETLLSFLLLRSFTAYTIPRFLQYCLDFCSVSIYSLAFCLLRLFILRLFSCVLFSLLHPSSLFLLSSSFGNILISQEICPHLHSSKPM